ncbi:uncharacterized protein [Eleutherodactylus coqui]|uniref:uncharacterized protein n=1 Tax=Eleutherodactylus coqui TaxID=57060 RepID=UPI003461D60B
MNITAKEKNANRLKPSFRKTADPNPVKRKVAQAAARDPTPMVLQALPEAESVEQYAIPLKESGTEGHSDGSMEEMWHICNRLDEYAKDLENVYGKRKSEMSPESEPAGRQFFSFLTSCESAVRDLDATSSTEHKILKSLYEGLQKEVQLVEQLLPIHRLLKLQSQHKTSAHNFNKQYATPPLYCPLVDNTAVAEAEHKSLIDTGLLKMSAVLHYSQAKIRLTLQLDEEVITAGSDLPASHDKVTSVMPRLTEILNKLEAMKHLFPKMHLQELPLTSPPIKINLLSSRSRKCPLVTVLGIADDGEISTEGVVKALEEVLTNTDAITKQECICWVESLDFLAVIYLLLVENYNLGSNKVLDRIIHDVGQPFDAQAVALQRLEKDKEETENDAVVPPAVSSVATHHKNGKIQKEGDTDFSEISCTRDLDGRDTCKSTAAEPRGPHVVEPKQNEGPENNPMGTSLNLKETTGENDKAELKKTRGRRPRKVSSKIKLAKQAGRKPSKTTFTSNEKTEKSFIENKNQQDPEVVNNVSNQPASSRKGKAKLNEYNAITATESSTESPRTKESAPQEQQQNEGPENNPMGTSLNPKETTGENEKTELKKTRRRRLRKVSSKIKLVKQAGRKPSKTTFTSNEKTEKSFIENKNQQDPEVVNNVSNQPASSRKGKAKLNEYNAITATESSTESPRTKESAPQEQQTSFNWKMAQVSEETSQVPEKAEKEMAQSGNQQEPAAMRKLRAEEGLSCDVFPQGFGSGLCIQGIGSSSRLRSCTPPFKMPYDTKSQLFSFSPLDEARRTQRHRGIGGSQNIPGVYSDYSILQTRIVKDLRKGYSSCPSLCRLCAELERKEW